MALEDVYRAVMEFREDEIAGLVQAELEAGRPVSEVLNRGLIAAMDEWGRRFGAGEAFVPELLMAAQTMKAGLEVLRPVLAAGDVEPQGTVVIGTVKGDLHDIGKNLVAMMLEGAGFRVLNLGVDVAPERFLEAASEAKADIVCMSALLTTTMPQMEATVQLIRERGLPFKTMVGGAPVTPEFAQRIGADGYSDDAPGAVALARRLLGLAA
ncbi:corrinoid protein [Deferrisoma palaeochoriense]